MKLCLLSSASSIHTAKWANHFSNKGDQVEVISFEPGRSIDVTVKVNRLGKPLPFRIHYFSSGREVRRLLRQMKPDILHAHYASGYGTLGRLAHFHPYILSVWGSDVFDFPKQSPIHRRLLQRNLDSAGRVCSTSHFMAREIQRYYKGKIEVIPFGVDCQQFRPRRKEFQREDEVVVGIVKTLEPKYGVEFLIRGFAIFSKKTARQGRSRLIIAGDGTLRNPLHRLARDLNINAQTTFLGFVPHEKVPEVLSRFSVFVAPSILESESFGVAVIEASASGLPVVVSRIGGLPEVVKDRVTGILVPPRDPEAIADALEELFVNEQLRAELGTNGRKFVLENYEWTENAGRMERIYDSLLRERN